LRVGDDLFSVDACLAMSVAPAAWIMYGFLPDITSWAEIRDSL
jgi:hypothetical protein